MTLNDLNTMQKADKYTQDGRDQIIDVGFEDGHISHRKDGDYIKQGGTWKPYTGGKGANGNNAEEKWQKNKNDFGRDRLTMKTRQGGQIHIYETENPNQKNARFRVDGGTHYNDFNTLEEAKAFAEKHWGPEEKPMNGTDWDSDMPGRTRKMAGDYSATVVKSGTKYMLQVRNTKTGEVKTAVESKDPEELKRMGDTELKKYTSTATKTETTGSESLTKHDDIGHEIQESIKAAQYYERQARNFQPSDPSYKTYMDKSKQYMKEAEQKADDAGFDFEEFDGAKRESAGSTEEKRSEAYKSGERLAEPSEQRQKKGYDSWNQVLSGYDDESLINQRKQLQNDVDEFEYDIKRYDRNKLANAVYKKRIDQNNWQIGGIKAIDEEIKARGLEIPTDSATRVLTGDTRLRLSQVKDRTYKPGEISQATGLQKQPDGSWAPPKNGATKGARNQTVAATKKPVASQKPAEKKSATENKPAAGSTIKFEDAQKAINNGQVVQWKDSDGVWHDVNPKTSELVMARDIGSKLRVKTDENGNPVKAKPEPGMDETRSKLLELEKKRKMFEKYPDMNNSIKLQQAALLSKAGFDSRAEFEEFAKSEMQSDSAPRPLTGDCKIRVKK